MEFLEVFLDILKPLIQIFPFKKKKKKTLRQKSIYVIKDNFFKFWFRYEFTNNSYYAMLGAKNASKEIMDDISKSGYAKSVIEQAKKDHATLLTIGGNLKSYSYFPYNFIIAIVSLYSR